MTQHMPDDLWHDFPKTATEFEARFATEEDCRAYWIKARWGGEPACARCDSKRVWTIRCGTTFECANCGHQTSLTSGTLLEKTRKPLKMWFRAVFEISTRRTGISAKDLQRIMGFGSYGTAWTWLHKLRAAMVRSDSEALGPSVQIDEALVGGKGGPNKELVLVAAESNGRIRLAHTDNNDAQAFRRRPNRDGRESSERWSRWLQREEPRQAASRAKRTDQSATPRERCGPRLSLDDLSAEALATRHTCRRGQRQTPAGLPRRICLPPQPPQDQRRWPHRSPRHRTARCPRPAADEDPRQNNGAHQVVPFNSGGASLS